MTVEVIKVSTDQLRRDREQLLRDLRITEDDLRSRVTGELATSDERAALERLKEIAFLLGEDE
ncbi:hypothetical protein SAMN05421837_104617 [Amycolatopsis pretoriensis]|uniref:Uncharacterized protein n=1 Tax=Amycolatopsis pretoriensis TaxID=218821 RepID=A0A1H5QT07_9PSEU|nr:MULTISPECIES: hypothetical protein [Amycolatopsis]SEF29272.1 hypothetical protein SAMN05421837_104617 [Amycolatopsis pretoriensis]